MSRNGPKTHEEARLKTFLDASKDGRTVQADANEADINKIIARFEKAGMISRLNSKEPFYGDVSDLDGLQDAYIKVKEADELFMKFPALIRERFENDPVALIDFIADKANYDEAVSLGMITPKPVEPPVPVDPAKP